MIIPVKIIEKNELVNRIKNSKKWVFVYGRRKTGKTFIVENNIEYDEYFFVNRKYFLRKDFKFSFLQETSKER